MVDSDTMKSTCAALMTCFENGYISSEVFHFGASGLSSVAALHQNGATTEVTVGDETYVVEIRHVDDEAI